MIVRFSVENYLSFKEKATINFQAASIKEFRENTFTPYISNAQPLLKSVGLFGNNASGKSNFIKAIAFMKNFILNSSKESSSNQEIEIQPFLLSTTSVLNPSTFEIVFYIEDIKYRYGFSVTRNFVESEWLFYTQKRKEELLFIRAKQEFNFDKSFKVSMKGKFELFEEVTRPNSLFVSVLTQFNNSLCQNISTWFNDIIIANDTAHNTLIESTARLMTSDDYKRLINQIMRNTIGIEGIEEQLKESSQQSSVGSFQDFVLAAIGEKNYNVNVLHQRYNQEQKNAGVAIFDLMKNESLGTQKLFGILGPILYALKQRKVIWIDEIDARLHTLLFDSLVGLFNSNKHNPNGAQLIYTAHNPHVMKKELRRDQIIGLNKDEYGSSTLCSVYENEGKIRNDASFDKDFLLGKYGGIPKLGAQLNLFTNELNDKKK